MSPDGSSDRLRSFPQRFEEVVVTARRREEREQDVAVSLTSVSGDGLEMRQIVAADQLAAVVPNLQFDSAAPSSGSSSAGQIYIRGIGQSDFTPVTDPGVALYVDNVYVARSPGNVLDFLDIERVEVLRGPQGTLFGRNAIGGAIKVHSARPRLQESSAGLRLRVGNDNLQSLALKANLPLGDDAAAKLVLNHVTRDGYVRRDFDGVDTGDRDRWSLRGLLLWDISTELSAHLAVDHARIRENGAPTVSGGVNDRQAFAAIGNGLLDGCESVSINPTFDASPTGGPPTFPPPGLASGEGAGCLGPGSVAGPFRSEGSFPVFSDLDTGGAVLELDWMLSNALRLVSTTAHRSMSMLSSRDGDNSPANIFATLDDFDHEQFSQEFQFSYTSSDEGLSALLGAFYFEESGFNLVDLTLPLGAIQSGGFYDNSAHALFAHVTADVTDHLSLSFGARRSNDRKSYLPDQFVLGDASAGTPQDFFGPTWPLLPDTYLAPTGPLAAGTRIIDFARTTEDFGNTDYTADLSYHFTDTLMAYASVSSGYKSGGFDQRFVGPTPDGRPSSYDPETVDNREIGLKGNWPKLGLRVNLALFDADYDDLQIIVRESFNPLTVNAGSARIRGGELEARWLPALGWDLTLSAGHIDGAYRELSQAAQNSGVLLDNQLVNAPQWSMTVGAGYEFDLGTYGSVGLRLDWSWWDEQFNDAVNDPRVRQGAYDVLNASVALRSRDERWQLSLASRNLLDERYLVAGNSAFATAAAYVEQVYARPRETILTLQYQY
ncbi:MAG: TonB-dependent receptor [Halieaceae bacterium]|nr:TonB-dependent receptor [Halieaceae bacterium]